MIIHIIELLFVAFMSLLYKAKIINRKTFIRISFFSMAFVVGSRAPSVGEDTQHFISVFNISKTIPWKTCLTSGFDVVFSNVYSARKIEAGYLLLNKIVAEISSNEQLILYAVAAGTFIFFGKFIYDNYRNPVIPTFYILCESLYMNSFSLMRQILAIAIVVQAYTLINKKQKIRAVLFAIFAFMIHKSVLVMFLIFYYERVKKKKTLIKITSVFTILIVLFYNQIVKIIIFAVPRYATYFNDTIYDSSLGLGAFVFIAFEIIISILLFRKRNLEAENDVYESISIMIPYLALEIIGLRLALFSRAAMVYKPLIARIYIDGQFAFSKKSRNIYITIIFVLFVLMYLSYAGSPARYYTFFWEK